MSFFRQTNDFWHNSCLNCQVKHWSDLFQKQNFPLVWPSKWLKLLFSNFSRVFMKKKFVNYFSIYEGNRKCKQRKALECSDRFIAKGERFESAECSNCSEHLWLEKLALLNATIGIIHATFTVLLIHCLKAALSGIRKHQAGQPFLWQWLILPRPKQEPKSKPRNN